MKANFSGNTMKMNQWAAVAALLLGSLASSAHAHELLLKSLRPPTAGRPTTFIVSNGDIDTSINSTPWDDVEDARIVGPRSAIHVAAPDWIVGEKTSSFHHTFMANGSYLLGVSTKPKVFVFSGQQFSEYLKEEHIEVAGRWPDGRTADAPIRERYAKHALAVVQLGARPAQRFRKTLGYPVEIRLQADPARLRPGQKLTVQVLAFGKPAANQIVLGGYEGYGHDAKGEPTNLLNLRTNAAGFAEFEVTTQGRWALHLVNMRPCDDAECDVESHYATVLFDIVARP